MEQMTVTFYQISSDFRKTVKQIHGCWTSDLPYKGDSIVVGRINMVVNHRIWLHDVHQIVVIGAPRNEEMLWDMDSGNYLVRRRVTEGKAPDWTVHANFFANNAECGSLRRSGDELPEQVRIKPNPAELEYRSLRGEMPSCKAGDSSGNVSSPTDSSAQTPEPSLEEVANKLKFWRDSE